MTAKSKALWAFAISSIALFMVVLDNLVVTTALPVIKKDLHASLQGLEWTVNAYTLTFAVLLLTGAALGDRFGRRRLLAIGLAIFTAASAAAALAPSVGWLIAARAVQGVGGAIVMPLTLTILSAAVPREKRAMALGAWSGVAGLAVAIGPLVGGAIVEGIAWQWIFWLNVPIGLVAIPLALRRAEESYGPANKLDVAGVALASVGLLGIVWGLVSGQSHGWTSAEVVSALVGGAILVAAFVAWELRARAPMLPMRFFRSRAFAASNASTFLMYLGMFGSVFLLTQYFQSVHGYSPLAAGLRILPWTVAPIFVSPIAALLSERVGSRPVIAVGLALQAATLAWIAHIATADVAYVDLLPALVLGGIGMSLFYAPTANVVLAAVRPEEEGQSSGANNALRELGGVFGVAVLASIFSGYGGYGSADVFMAGFGPALYVGAAFVAVGAIAATMIPGRERAEAPQLSLQGAC
jgi:EmrB/QacA subfamily drug resistance transporter